MRRARPRITMLVVNKTGSPPAIDPLDLGGSWSAYWYNNFIYETNITEGLNIFRFSGKQTAGAILLDHLNPQTQEFTID